MEITSGRSSSKRYSDGTIRTFFKPKNGADYFKNEVTKDLGEEASKAIK